MRKTETGLSLSATDLSNSLACQKLTSLDMSVALEGRKHLVANASRSQRCGTRRRNPASR